MYQQILDFIMFQHVTEGSNESSTLVIKACESLLYFLKNYFSKSMCTSLLILKCMPATLLHSIKMFFFLIYVLSLVD